MSVLLTVVEGWVPHRQTLQRRFAYKKFTGESLGSSPIGDGESRTEQTEKWNCSAVVTKELFQIATRRWGLCGHFPIDLPGMEAASRRGGVMRLWARQLSAAEDIPKEGHS